MNWRKRLATDVDDVLAKFSPKVIDLVNQKLNLELRLQDKMEFDLSDSFNLPILDDIWKEEVERGGFVRDLEPYQGAKQAIKTLDDYGIEVYALTSAPLLKNWHYERSLWLIEHMNIPFKRHIQTAAKYTVQCDFFVDDKLENLYNHAQRWPNTTHIIMDQPWNQVCSNKKFVRAHDWSEIVDIITNW